MGVKSMSAEKKREYWEDYEVGAEWHSPARTITESCVDLFAGLTGDFNAIHVDKEYAKKTPFGERLAHGLLIGCIGTGLTTTLKNFYEDVEFKVLVSVTFDFKKPVFIGDTVRVVAKVKEKRETKNPERGLIVFERTILNQKNEVVQVLYHTYLFSRKP
jgi:acyl dehydratase